MGGRERPSLPTLLRLCRSLLGAWTSCKNPSHHSPGKNSAGPTGRDTLRRARPGTKLYTGRSPHLTSVFHHRSWATLSCQPCACAGARDRGCQEASARRREDCRARNQDRAQDNEQIVLAQRELQCLPCWPLQRTVERKEVMKDPVNGQW